MDRAFHAVARRLAYRAREYLAIVPRAAGTGERNEWHGQRVQEDSRGFRVTHRGPACAWGTRAPGKYVEPE